MVEDFFVVFESVSKFSGSVESCRQIFDFRATDRERIWGDLVIVSFPILLFFIAALE